MIELKSKNLLIKKGMGGDYGINKIFEFIDLIGKGFLYMHTGTKSTLGSLLKCSKVRFKRSDFQEKLEDNVFRVSYIIIECDDVAYYSNIVQDITDIPTVFITGVTNTQFEYNRLNISSRFDTAYIVGDNENSGFTTISLSSAMSFTPKTLEDYIVEDINNDWKANLKELKIQFIRDKNLKDLFGE